MTLEQQWTFLVFNSCGFIVFWVGFYFFPPLGCVHPRISKESRIEVALLKIHAAN